MVVEGIESAGGRCGVLSAIQAGLDLRERDMVVADFSCQWSGMVGDMLCACSGGENGVVEIFECCLT